MLVGAKKLWIKTVPYPSGSCTNSTHYYSTYLMVGLKTGCVGVGSVHDDIMDAPGVVNVLP